MLWESLWQWKKRAVLITEVLIAQSKKQAHHCNTLWGGPKQRSTLNPKIMHRLCVISAGCFQNREEWCWAILSFVLLSSEPLPSNGLVQALIHIESVPYLYNYKIMNFSFKKSQHCLLLVFPSNWRPSPLTFSWTSFIWLPSPHPVSFAADLSSFVSNVD